MLPQLLLPWFCFFLLTTFAMPPRWPPPRPDARASEVLASPFESNTDPNISLFSRSATAAFDTFFGILSQDNGPFLPFFFFLRAGSFSSSKVFI